MKIKYFKVLMLAVLTLFISCKKYLEEKPRTGLYVPNSIEDLQAILDASRQFNISALGTSLIELCSDDYYVSYANWQSAAVTQRLYYIWDDQGNEYENWSLPYTQVVSKSNMVLAHVAKIDVKGNVNAKNNVEGSALFFRACAFYQLAQLYCKPYSSTANIDLGIVLRTTDDVEVKSSRSNVQETYSQILNDLIKASELLPDNSVYVTRPSKGAAFAMLARVYLSMRDYENALRFTDSALEKYNKLLDFNDLILTKSPILPLFTTNPEIIFFSSLFPFGGLTSATAAKIDSTLYNSYHTNDIRKAVFFQQNTGVNVGSYRFRGSYFVTNNVFNGLSTGELYLIKAECLARNGSTAEAMSTLNILLRRRYNKNDFIDFKAGNAIEAKAIILAERRKELICRGQRWSDLRRFNLEGANITLKRVLNGQTYTLPPNDPRWVMLIPNEEITRSGIPQNLR